MTDNATKLTAETLKQALSDIKALSKSTNKEIVADVNAVLVPPDIAKQIEDIAEARGVSIEQAYAIWCGRAE